MMVNAQSNSWLDLTRPAAIVLQTARIGVTMRAIRVRSKGPHACVPARGPRSSTMVR